MRELQITSPALAPEDWRPACCGGCDEDLSPELHIGGLESTMKCAENKKAIEYGSS